MKAVIMAGGFGKRLRPVTGDRPKPMADILGRPIMEHILRHLKNCGFDQVCAAVKYRAGDIIGHFGDGSALGIELQYRIEDAPLGTAGAVKNCADFYGDEDFLVISGDAACDFRLDELMKAHKKSGAALSIALYRNPEPLRFGLALPDAEGRVRAFIEKPDWPHVVTDMVNTGIYVISPRVMDMVPLGREYDFGKELFPLLLRRGEKIMGFEMEGYWRDMGSPGDYFRCCADAWEGKWALPVGTGVLDGPRTAREGGPYEEEGGIFIPVADRAGVMGIVSAELMELGADYAQGLRLKTPRFLLRLYPAAEESALYLSVSSADEKLAGKMLSLMRDAIEKIEK